MIVYARIALLAVCLAGLMAFVPSVLAQTNERPTIPDEYWDSVLLQLPLLQIVLLDELALGLSDIEMDDLISNWMLGDSLSSLGLGDLISNWMLEVLSLHGIALSDTAMGADWLAIADQQYNRLLAAWEQRWGRMIDYYGMDAVRIVPHPGTPLGLYRERLLRAILAEPYQNAWSVPTQELWDSYYNQLSYAIKRSQILRERQRR